MILMACVTVSAAVFHPLCSALHQRAFALREFNQLDSKGTGALLVAMTDLELSQDIKSRRGEVQLSHGDVQWFAGNAPTLKNMGTQTGEVCGVGDEVSWRARQSGF